MNLGGFLHCPLEKTTDSFYVGFATYTTIFSLVEYDPALIVTPPRGFESGYVPIATDPRY